MQRAGPCAAGTHPASRSPFGVDDLAGSEWEWTAGPADVAQPAQGVTRGGGYVESGAILLISGLGTMGPSDRVLGVGLRVCAGLK